MDKTKKIIAIVAAALVVLAGGIGAGYKIWFNEDMPKTEADIEVVDTVVVADTVEVVEVVTDTVFVD